MSREQQSQWDFGGLPEQGEARKVYGVAELNRKAKGLLENQLGTVWVEGQVTGLRRQSSGHIYFGIKDEKGQLGCALFRGTDAENRSLIEDGTQVLLQGDVTLFEARGQYQLIVRKVEPLGQGALQVKFEKLKRKLEAEGLFAPGRKRALPCFPARIGLVTSPTGAAIRDVLHVVFRRNPSLQIVLEACRVQGAIASTEMSKAVHRLNQWSARQSEPLDLILLTRGGGSLEDLWAFNEENLARAIFDCSTPVISSIGHETDTTIADFVADLRAPTPSAAAVSATPDLNTILYNTSKLKTYLYESIKQSIESKKSSLALLKLRIIDPSQQLLFNAQKLDDYELRLLKLNQSLIEENKEKLKLLFIQFKGQYENYILKQQNQLSNYGNVLNLLSPLNTLSRGYTITQSRDGKILTSIKNISSKDLIITQFHDGKLTSKVVNKEDN